MFFRGVDDLLKSAWRGSKSPTPIAVPPKQRSPLVSKKQPRRQPLLPQVPLAKKDEEEATISSRPVPPNPSSNLVLPVSKPLVHKRLPSLNETKLRGVNFSSSPSSPSSLQRKAEHKIKDALAILVSAAEDRSKALRANTCKNDEYDKKDEAFRNLKCSMGGPVAVIGNNVVRASKRNEVDTAIEELQIKKKCDIIYDEGACLEFYNEHKTVLLQMAMQYFSRASTSKCSGLEVDIRSGVSDFDNRVLIKDKKNRCRPLAHDYQESSVSTTRWFIDVKGVPRRVMEKHFSGSSTVQNAPTAANPNMNIRPSERANLDITKAEASHVFSTLRRLDTQKPLYFVGGTFYQQRAKRWGEDGFEWVEVIGWDEREASKVTVGLVKPTEANLFVMPPSFKEMASILLNKYCNHLSRNSFKGNPGSRNYFQGAETFKLLNPKVDSAMEHKNILDRIDTSLDTLLALGKNSAFTKATIIQYRRKFRRYVLFCFTMYAINADSHCGAVSPLPFNFFNLFSYMYCHGKQMTASSFLSTLTFIENHIFKPMSSAAPAVSAKRLLDIDSAVMKGGKAACIRDFGCPVKTSLHTRTLVSFLGFAEMSMGVMSGLLLAPSRLSERLVARVTKSLERWCDAIIFIFFTFVLFHRFSGVKLVSLKAALKLAMGQTHAHANKVRAAKRLRLRKNDQTEPTREEWMKCFSRQNFAQDEIDTSGLTLSHPHLLGLPYTVQAALGIPVSKINPLMASSSGGVSLGGVGRRKYQMGGLLGSKESLRGNFPAEGGAAGNLGMFENFVKETIDDFYGLGSFSNMTSAVMKRMQEKAPYDASSYLIRPAEEEEEEEVEMEVEEDEGMGGEQSRPQKEEVEKRAYSEKSEMASGFILNRDVVEYLMASPMRMVFVIVLDSELNERFLSIGDLTILAIWVKKYVLKLPWDSPAIGRSSYDWLGSAVCGNLLLSDLANFGVWGDVKIVNRLDTHSNTFHRDGERLPNVKDQKKFVKNSTLKDRKSLARLHSCINIRTRTHLGRVTAASWAVDAIRTITRGDKDAFATLAVSLDLYHLGHTNNVNFMPYFSNNYASNEQEMGLWGFVRRTSEKLAKEEMDRGRLCNLGDVGFANSNLAAAALAISASTDLGEAQAVLDDGARARKAGVAIADSNKSRERLRTQGLQKLVGDRPRRGDCTQLKLKDLWKYFADPVKRRRLVEGKAISILCPTTGFLNTAAPDAMVHYAFDSTSSCVRLKMKLLAPPLEESGRKRPTKLSSPPVDRKRQRTICEDNAVLSIDADVMTYDKFNLAPTEDVRQRMVQQDKQCRLAAGIKKVCGRSRRRGASANGNDDRNEREQVLDDLNKLMYLV
nr:MAG: wsv433-like protein [Metapenaeus ensis nimavirus]